MRELLERLEPLLQKGAVRLAIEGGSAAGKTTLAKELESIFDCTVFHMDDFFLRPAQRTPARLSEPGGNVDRERFLQEVLQPMAQGLTVEYRRYDCATGSLLPPRTVHPRRLTVVEGAYSMHPELAGYYDLSVFLEIDPALQRERILKRNTPAQAERFFNEWIPLERRYFEATDASARCDLILAVKK